MLGCCYYEREGRERERKNKLTVTSSFTESRISLFIFWADSINCMVGKDDIIITSLLQLHTAKRWRHLEQTSGAVGCTCGVSVCHMAV